MYSTDYMQLNPRSRVTRAGGTSACEMLLCTRELKYTYMRVLAHRTCACERKRACARVHGLPWLRDRSSYGRGASACYHASWIWSSKVLKSELEIENDGKAKPWDEKQDQASLDVTTIILLTRPWWWTMNSLRGSFSHYSQPNILKSKSQQTQSNEPVDTLDGFPRRSGIVRLFGRLTKKKGCCGANSEWNKMI